MSRPQSAITASLKIMAGTIIGGVIGFYVMHRMEVSYKEKMQERFRQYQLQQWKLKLEDPERLPDTEALKDA